jgi:hypothetical protein
MIVPRVGPVVRYLAILEPRYQVQSLSLDAEPHGDRLLLVIPCRLRRGRYRHQSKQ